MNLETEINTQNLSRERERGTEREKKNYIIDKLI